MIFYNQYLFSERRNIDIYDNNYRTRTLVKEDCGKVIVLTARQPESKDSIKSFFESQGIAGVAIFGVDGSVNKKEWLYKLIKRFNISKSVTVFEDSVNNIKDLLTAEYDFPDLFVHFSVFSVY